METRKLRPYANEVQTVRSNLPRRGEEGSFWLGDLFVFFFFRFLVQRINSVLGHREDSCLEEKCRPVLRKQPSSLTLLKTLAYVYSYCVTIFV